jgi:hypothetical protein
MGTKISQENAAYIFMAKEEQSRKKGTTQYEKAGIGMEL